MRGPAYLIVAEHLGPDGQVISDDPTEAYILGFFHGIERRGDQLPPDLDVPLDDEFIPDREVEQAGPSSAYILEALAVVWEQFDQECHLGDSDQKMINFWLGALHLRYRIKAHVQSLEAANAG